MNTEGMVQETRYGHWDWYEDLEALVPFGKYAHLYDRKGGNDPFEDGPTENSITALPNIPISIHFNYSLPPVGLVKWAHSSYKGLFVSGLIKPNLLDIGHPSISGVVLHRKQGPIKFEIGGIAWVANQAGPSEVINDPS